MACSRAYPSYLGTVILTQSLSTREGMSATLENLNVSLPSESVLSVSSHMASGGRQSRGAYLEATLSLLKPFETGLPHGKLSQQPGSKVGQAPDA
jgi:hypothetical protein